MKRTVKPLWPLLTLGMTSFLGWGRLLFTQVNFNASTSLPYQAFFCVKGLPLKGLACKRGDFVCITGHHTLYSGDLPLTKRVAGFPGETICIKKDQMFVDGRCVGTLCNQTKDGKPLTPLKARIIPDGHLFVSADHLRSFDSRYEEFGLVKQTCVSGKCWGLCERDRPPQEGNTL